ncbi:DUF2752 domain-containing protein [Winogradskyella sp.]|jgi:hypothetical protein|uniref:DUF2752 domain-containing protein n=1 Tax=Winogradskyella sp. TaxID=1883156 RepID=UPI0026014627|nr:DUF2752 domain-containing protein [Winogradskyella sp.]MCT4629108.1 DUF2752 domain-containing protein [Winogradskyella sp.]
MLILIKGLEDYMLPCMWKKTFNIDCIGCGIQRSIAYILKGEFINAFFMYPAIYPMLFLFVFFIFDSFMNIKHNEKIKLGLAALTLTTAITNYILKLFF